MGLLRKRRFLVAALAAVCLAHAGSALAHQKAGDRGREYRLPELKSQDPKLSELLPALQPGEGVALLRLDRGRSMRGRVAGLVLVKGRDGVQVADTIVFVPGGDTGYNCANGGCSCGGSGNWNDDLFDCLDMLPRCSHGTYEGGSTDGGYGGSCQECFRGVETDCP